MQNTPSEIFRIGNTDETHMFSLLDTYSEGPHSVGRLADVGQRLDQARLGCRAVGLGLGVCSESLVRAFKRIQMLGDADLRDVW